MTMDMLLLAMLALGLSAVDAQSDPVHGVNYDENYILGIVAHTAGEWKKCIPYLK